MSTDLVHDVLGQTPHPLDLFFSPRHIAVIGATETPGSVGRTLLWNLISSPFGGVVYPVNLKRPSVLGIKAYPTIGDVPAQVDLAVIVTPAATVPGIIKECVQAGVRAAIVISAGFKELGNPGQALEKELEAAIAGSSMRLIGPNCLGVMSPTTGLNATFAKGIAKPGHVAFLSQSGALLTAVLDWSQREQVGFRACVSLGSMLDVSWGDLIDYFGNDPHTQSILIYMESIGNARSFLSAAREVALNKPIIVIKAGRTSAAAKAAASHTGSMTGSDEVLDAAFERVGVLRVGSIAELFDMAGVLSKQPRPKGPRLSIITNAGGPAVLATDALIQAGGSLTELSQDTLNKLSEFLPPAWSHNNPIDILGDADATRYEKTLEAAAKDPQSDGLLVILTPQDMTQCTLTAQKLVPYARGLEKPLLASWMGGAQVAEGIDLLNRAGIPTFSNPDMAAKAFSYMWRYTDNLKSIYETPCEREELYLNDSSIKAASQMLAKVSESGRTLLSEIESKQLMAAYGLPVTAMRLAKTEDQAIEHANQIGYPVVVKLHSETLTHKTDVGGVKLNLQSSEEVKDAFRTIKLNTTKLAGEQHFQGVSIQPMIRLKDAYELIVGSSVDPQFGPVLICGTGGQLVEVFKDYRLALPPMNTTLARRMLEKTKIYKALQGVRGRPSVCMDKLEQMLVRFSQLVVEHPQIAEIEINPLLISSEGMAILDARVVLHPLDIAFTPKTAIRPYPRQYTGTFTLKDQTSVQIRPIRPEDEPLVVRFHETLSERSVHLRFFTPMPLCERITHERMIRVCCSDYDREIALVVQRLHNHKPQEIIAIGRLSRLPNSGDSKFTMLISDQWQGRGLGTALLRKLLDIATQEQYRTVRASMSPENHEMQHICQKLGFKLKASKDGKQIEACFHIGCA